MEQSKSEKNKCIRHNRKKEALLFAVCGSVVKNSSSTRRSPFLRHGAIGTLPQQCLVKHPIAEARCRCREFLSWLEVFRHVATVLLWTSEAGEPAVLLLSSNRIQIIVQYVSDEKRRPTMMQ